MDYDQEDTRKYKVVRDDEGYTSIWLAHKEIPKGWKPDGKEGLKTECLNYIKEKYPENPEMSSCRKFHNLPDPASLQ